MRKIFFLFISVFCFATLFAQQEAARKKQTLGFSFFLNDFKTATNIRTNGLVSVLKDKSFFKPSAMNSGIAINYLSGISKHVDFIATLGSSFVNYPIDNKPAFNDNKFLLETTASLNLKLLSDKYVVVPFIDLGVGASNYTKYFSAFTPVGAGLQINFSDVAYLLLNSQYRIPVTENASYHFYYSLTVIGNIISQK